MADTDITDEDLFRSIENTYVSRHEWGERLATEDSHSTDTHKSNENQYVETGT